MNEELENAQEISKSQRKREAQAQQDLGLRLTALKPQQLDQMPISETVISAITEFQNLPNSHGAKRRQLQYIGKLMRDCDYEAVNSAIESLISPQRTDLRTKQSPDNSTTANWMKRLETDGDVAISDLLEIQPLFERQKLRQLIRNLQKSAAQQKPRHRAKLQSYIEQFDME